MSPRIIYNNEFIILEQRFKHFFEMKLIYALFFIDPQKLVNSLSISFEESVDYFEHERPILKLFNQAVIYDSWAKMSLCKKKQYYKGIYESNTDLCELIDESLKIDSDDSLIKILEQCQSILNQKVDIDTATTFMVPIGNLSLKYKNYYVLTGLKLEEPNQFIYLYNDLQLELNNLFLRDYGPFGGWTNIWKLVFPALDTNEIFIGGDAEGNISLDTVDIIKKHLVKKSEADVYINKQNSIFLQDFFEDTKLLELDEQLSIHQTKRVTGTTKVNPIQLDVEDQDVLGKVNSALQKHVDQLKLMLEKNENDGPNEKDYQTLLLKIFPYIFPQYTQYIREYAIKIDGNSKKKADKPDYLALKSDLSIDVIEIKTPYKNVFRSTRYRSNFVFDREVVGLITQTQKYIYNLERNAVREEKIIAARFNEKTEFNGSKINIASPKGIVIVGRRPRSDSKLSPEEQTEINLSLSILKGRFQDIVDFLTYDDIVERVERIVARSTKQIDIS
ncbi:Shedu anti-phage system protein SduA domain-containing protein [Leuconostoc gasicomitatum]|uniref:Shedu anti-phage system protein SduA domain-containing protein n=1 Tax=Leuconostoc gasicomitatum TaxID=115778 RepID=UPI001CC42C7F|nr:Shedu anti-phage system protein SduA domain-containing protein [Leuconostoc gasicomitatum]MBZ5960805.1 DUF4263 domain-containing protein [Leuconostoc gasicomitatum]MBZ5969782.1 DUF4263 domain-containing protein [Leuconostoc gasicomitatum]MBZ5998252.1 DUF4263 domain-containing protein [Leuconostoc gasicomitatum]